MKSKSHSLLAGATPRCRLPYALTLAAALALGASAAHATDYTWSGTTGNWTDTTWTPGPIAGPTASTDTAAINAGQVTIDGATFSQAINSAIFIGSGATLVANATAPNNVTLNGNLTGSGTLNRPSGNRSLVLQGDNSGFSGTINAASNVLFYADSAGSAAADWVVTGGNFVSTQSGAGHVIKLGSLAGNAGNIGNNFASSEVTFEIGGNGKTTSYSGTIVNTPSGWAGGTTAITKVGGGTLTLSGTNTYTGTTKVNDGILALQGGGGGGTNYNGGNLSINGASTLRVNGQRYNFSGKTFTFDSVGGGTLDAIADGAGGLVFTGNNDITTNGGAQNTISGTGAGNQGFNLGGQTATFNVAVGSTPSVANLNITGKLWNSGNIVKTGAGILLLGNSANSYAGTTTISEGTLLATNAGALPGYNAASKVSVASGATLAVRAGAVSGEWSSAQIDSVLGATTNAFTSGSKLGIDVTTGNSFTYANNIGATQTAKGLVKSGDGTLTLANNTYTGATTVAAGVLAVNGSITSATTVQTGGTLQGTGTITGAVTVDNGGTLASGNSIGTITSTSVSYAAGATFAVEVKPTATIGSDKHILTGTSGATLSFATVGNTNLTLNFDGADANLALRTRFILADYSAITSGTGWNGGFLNYGGNILDDGEQFDWGLNRYAINYNDLLQGVNPAESPFGGDLTNGGKYLTLTVVPEPTATAFGLLALGGLALRRRR